VRSSAYGSRFRVQGLESGNVDPMRATASFVRSENQLRGFSVLTTVLSTLSGYLTTSFYNDSSQRAGREIDSRTRTRNQNKLRTGGPQFGDKTQGTVGW
jgi:hypothetical protein